MRIVPIFIMALIALATVPTYVEAIPTTIVTTLPPGANYAWIQVTPPPVGTPPADQCVGFTYRGNVTYTGSAWVGGFWAWGIATGFGNALVVPASGDRVIFSDGASPPVTISGARPNWGGFDDELHVNFETFIGKICGNTLQRVGFVTPDATDGKVEWRFGFTTTVVNSGSGSNGFQLRPEDFAGTYVDVGLGDSADFQGASVGANMVSPTITLPRGMMAALFTQAPYARLSASGPGAFGTKISDCATTPPASFVRFQQCQTQTANFGGLGMGYRVAAPAGGYTFRVEREIAAEPMHAYVVGAPFDWR